MDLSIPVDNYILNIRVLVLVKSGDKYVFQLHKDGYYFGVGGRIMIGESSHDAAIREISEELGVSIINLKFKTVIENFSANYHEICFVYTCEDVDSDKMSEFPFFMYDKYELQNIDLRPEILKKIILDCDECERGYIVNK